MRPQAGWKHLVHKNTCVRLGDSIGHPIYQVFTKTSVEVIYGRKRAGIGIMDSAAYCPLTSYWIEIMFKIFRKKTDAEKLQEIKKNTLKSLSMLAPEGPKADVESAADMAYELLLSRVIDKDAIREESRRLVKQKIPLSTQDLALIIALVYFKKPELRELLRETQLKARMQMLLWMHDKSVNPLIVKTFEGTLYKDFHPNNR